MVRWRFPGSLAKLYRAGERSRSLSIRNPLWGRVLMATIAHRIVPTPVPFTGYLTILVTFQSAHRVGRHVACHRLSKSIPPRA